MTVNEGKELRRELRKTAEELKRMTRERNEMVRDQERKQIRYKQMEYENERIKEGRCDPGYGFIIFVFTIILIVVALRDGSKQESEVLQDLGSSNSNDDVGKLVWL